MNKEKTKEEEYCCIHCGQHGGHYLGLCTSCDEVVCSKCGTIEKGKYTIHDSEWCLCDTGLNSRGNQQ